MLTRTDDAHCQDGVVAELWVRVMAELAESVQNLKLRVRHIAQSEGQRNNPLDRGFSETELYEKEKNIQ